MCLVISYNSGPGVLPSPTGLGRGDQNSDPRSNEWMGLSCSGTCPVSLCPSPPTRRPLILRGSSRPCAPSLLPLTLRHHLSCVPLLSGRVNLYILPAHSENLFKSSAPPLPRPLDPRNRSDSLSFLTLEVCDGWSVSTQHQ